MPAATQLLITISHDTARLLVPDSRDSDRLWLIIKMIRKFKHGRMGWDLFMLNWPVFGTLIEKNSMARSTRTLGTLVASGCADSGGAEHHAETCGNAMFERLFAKGPKPIREGETIAKPMKEYSRPGFHPVALLLWVLGSRVLSCRRCSSRDWLKSRLSVVGLGAIVGAAGTSADESPRRGRPGGEHGRRR